MTRDRRRHARLLPARLRHVDPAPTTGGIRTTSASASSAQGLTRPGAARPVRPGRQGAPAGRRRAQPIRWSPPRCRPSPTGAIDVRLTTLFAHDKTAGSYVRSLFFIDPAGLTFVDGADGRHERRPVAAAARRRRQRRSRSARRAIQVPLRLDDDAVSPPAPARPALQRAAGRSSEPGGYQIRAAVQDDRSNAIGTGAQFVEVPKVGKDHVALSGVVMMDVAAGTGAPGEPPTARPVRTDVIADGVLGEPAIKIFKPGQRGRLHLRDLRRPRQARGRASRRARRCCATARRSTPRRRRPSAARRRTPRRSAPSRSAARSRSAAACRAAPTRCRSASRRSRATAAIGRRRSGWTSRCADAD